MSWTITGAEKTPVDPYRSQVSLLLHGDLVTTSTNIVDSSPTPKTVTPVDNAQISTAVADPFGNNTGVLAFDGTGDYLTTAPSSSNNFGSSNFTIEFWINSTKTARSDPFSWNYNFASAGWAGFIFNLAGSGSMAWFENTNSRISASSTGWNNGSWNHVALTRSANSVRMFLSGAQVGSTYTTSHSYGAGPSGFIVGDVVGGGGAVNGYIDDLRITKGVSRYESGTGANAGKMVFAGTNTLALPTAPFPDI